MVAAIGCAARAENQDAARRIAAIGEWAARRCADDEHAHWACDDWDAAAAEVSAILGVTHGRASTEMLMAVSLRHRLPRVAELFTAGSLSYRVCAAIVNRTDLIEDRETLALVDTAIADDALTWGPTSELKLQRAIDFWVDRYDPGALRQVQSRVRDRDIVVDLRNAKDGVVEIRGSVQQTDGVVIEARLIQLAHAVCEDDPRTIGQRRSDAMGAIAAGWDHLACLCGNPDCPAAEPDGRAASVIVHVVAEADILDTQPDPAIHGEKPEPEPESPRPRAGGVVTGNRGIVPAPLLAELIRAGAKVRELRRPSDVPEPQYRPSTALDEFVRMRDMTCRYPNCDLPAEYCDVDHTIPWPWGPTHPSNLACKCRKHHLLKTFWAGWDDQQHPDGTITWTSPTGHTYTTQPGSRLLLPRWNVTTATLPPPVGQPPPTTGIMMPTRRKTRAAQRAYRITAERKLNDARVAQRNKPPPF
ncbi:HNH endonuclease signature motif containing protein [Mycolicibacterium sarraceniae]|uniref:HNH endonuclease signature motif containing protein n=1 Tax=Mycolicibacterium sarraceniae TaxID=1534348 RepID=UPI001F347A10|nr:HNH endonuclease signature motif containing protein [Mycolicibacterium sarraceniae]